MSAYPGPLHEEPLGIELHNTLYIVRGDHRDGIRDQPGADAWLQALAPRLPDQARGAVVSAGDLRDLRQPVRRVLEAVAIGKYPPKDAVRVLNAVSAAAPRALAATFAADGALRIDELRPGATPAAAVLAALAESALELAGGATSSKLQYCGAPGCALLFLREHPRREWCSPTCGNRARQARLWARRRRAHQAPRRGDT